MKTGIYFHLSLPLLPSFLPNLIVEFFRTLILLFLKITRKRTGKLKKTKPTPLDSNNNCIYKAHRKHQISGWDVEVEDSTSTCVIKRCVEWGYRVSCGAHHVVPLWASVECLIREPAVQLKGSNLSEGELKRIVEAVWSSDHVCGRIIYDCLAALNEIFLNGWRFRHIWQNIMPIASWFPCFNIPEISPSFFF